MKKLYTDYNQSRQIRDILIAKNYNSFVGILTRETTNSPQSFHINEITDRNRKIVESLIDVNRKTTMPVYCLTDLLEFCNNNNIEYKDIEQLHGFGFNVLVERIVNYGRNGNKGKV